MAGRPVKQTKRKSNLPPGPGPGREKGSKNKFTNLKQAFLDTYDKIEKESKKDDKIKSLFKWATKNDRNQGVFYQLISKMLPSNVGMEISGEDGEPIKIEFIPVKKRKKEDDNKAG